MQLQELWVSRDDVCAMRLLSAGAAVGCSLSDLSGAHWMCALVFNGQC